MALNRVLRRAFICPQCLSATVIKNTRIWARNASAVAVPTSSDPSHVQNDISVSSTQFLRDIHVNDELERSFPS